MTKEEKATKQLKEACQIVERHCRQLGRDCSVIFMDSGVSIAPTSWPGDSTGATLFEALLDAEIT